MADLTPEARIRRAEQVVREQRSRGVTLLEDAILEHLPAGEVFYLQELVRLQRAVMGEREPNPDAEAELASWPRRPDGQTLVIPRPAA